jgi:NADPH2:quinone reductase
MRAARYTRPGPAGEVIEVTDVETPEPQAGEVRVRIAFSGVNPTDWKARSAGSVDGWQIPNQDGSGVIEAVGDGVEPARIGKTVLVAGGAGAVGRCAIELARWAGAGRIVATVSNDEKAQIALSAGADATVNYKAADAVDQAQAAARGGAHRIVELSLGHNLELDLAAAARDCAIVSYANEGPNPELAVRKLMTPNIVLRFVLVYTMPVEAIGEAVVHITDALRDGALTEPPLHIFPLEQTAAAHDAVERGAVGKVLIKVAGQRKSGASL